MEIILGGTHGLGWELASQLRETGKKVFVVGRTYNEARHGVGMRADMTLRSDAESVATYIDGLGKTTLHGFWWVVGRGFIGQFAEQTNVAEMLDVNVTYPLVVAQTAWRKMAVQHVQNDLVVVSSTTGIKIRNNETTYATTKGAQVSFARNLQSEAVSLGSRTRVVLFEPGGMKSPFWDGMRPANYDNFMNPSDVAAFIIHNLQRPNAESEKMIEKTVLDAWLAEGGKA